MRFARSPRAPCRTKIRGSVGAIGQGPHDGDRRSLDRTFACRRARAGRRGDDVTTYLGIDLAWAARAKTGLAALDEDGRLVASTSVVTDDEIAAFVDDARPRDGRRRDRRSADRPERHRLTRARASSSPRSSARTTRAPTRPTARARSSTPRAARRCASGSDGTPIPATPPGRDRSVAIEVYPHPAMVVLFALATVLPYKAKRGRGLEGLQTAFLSLLDHMEGACDEPLRLTSSPRWAQIRVRGGLGRTGRRSRPRRGRGRCGALRVPGVALGHRLTDDARARRRRQWLHRRPGQPVGPSAASDEGELVVPGLNSKEIAAADPGPSRDDDRLTPRNDVIRSMHTIRFSP